MRLSTQQFEEVLGILEKIDSGVIRPRMPDRIGRFLRQYEHGRGEIAAILARQRLTPRKDAAVSGRALGAIDIHPFALPDVSVMGFPLGEVAGALAISEQLGGPVNIAMWLKGSAAGVAYDLLSNNPGARLEGDYRWTPPSRVTLGEAHVDVCHEVVDWRFARCLKAVADDFARPPHALEYVVDYRIGPPGLKFFRATCAIRHGSEWRVLPGLTHPRTIEVRAVISAADVPSGALVLLLAYCEPWSREWTIVDATPISAEDAFAHAICWADFQLELDDSELEPAIIAKLRSSLIEAGYRPRDTGTPSLTRSLLPIARDIRRWLNGKN